MRLLMAPLLLVASVLSAADSVTVDGAGVLVVAGSAPADPLAGEVRAGGGNLKIGRASQAVGAEAVRGDDPRLSNSRPAAGGDADTVDGKHAADFLAASSRGAVDGVASLDAAGVVPVTQIPGGLATVAPVSITAAATLTSAAFGRLHQISGTTADFTVTLPTATPGAIVSFSVAPWATANRRYTIAAASQTIDAKPSLVLVHTNYLELIAISGGWISRVKKVDTDWMDAGAIAVAATGLPLTKGAVQTDTVRWRRVGNSMDVAFEYAQTTAGVNGSGEYLFAIPGGHVIDTTQIRVNAVAGPASVAVGTVVGHGEYSGIPGIHYPGAMIATVYDATRLRFVVNADGTTQPSVGYVGPAFVGFGAANHGYSVRASVPILGW